MDPPLEQFGAWTGLSVLHVLEGGHRNEVWAGSLDRLPVAVRRSRRSTASLSWELDLLNVLDQRGFLVPLPIPTDDGRLSNDGIVVQRWVDGREPSTAADWRIVADELHRLHETCADIAQRPGCCIVGELPRLGVSVDADLSALPTPQRELIERVFESFGDVAVSLIHGDPGPSNLRITGDGRVGLLDWDESRVDVIWHDLSNLGIQVLDDVDHACAVRLSDAWEAANAWIAEPEYARRRLAKLGEINSPLETP